MKGGADWTPTLSKSKALLLRWLMAKIFMVVLEANKIKQFVKKVLHNR